jgi:mannitol/fructose-specific phosphotransferase system IIA component
MSAKLYQFAVIKHPTKKQAEENSEKSVLIVDVKTVLATDEKAAALIAARAIPEEHMSVLDQLEVVVRPF